jgi:hypothetical protein
LKFLLEACKASGTGNSVNEHASRSCSLEDRSGSFEKDSHAGDVFIAVRKCKYIFKKEKKIAIQS